ncbi:MAG: phosphatidylglycerol lysyltransferase domain-containing protein [Treponema sp.]|jgi:hypothetical protein|nr:phosphatidylglycerol lysyltransferase domain-containing protein [Treponema sp.]
MLLPCYPDFVPISIDLNDDMHRLLSQTIDGVSEYTFANLYLFRGRYNYRVSCTQDKALILSGERDGKKFFATPCALPEKNVLDELFALHDYWKGIPDSIYLPNREQLEAWGIEIVEDRDNFDYLYLRTDLAELSGKKYHKKRNLVNQYVISYVHHETPLTPELVPHALAVLDHWREDKGEEGDYAACREVLGLFDRFPMNGALYYINNRPVGWCLGESLAGGSMFAIHFEKALDRYKGIYQFINQHFASSLPEQYTYINREQDLGDEGLRQAKMTYRPAGFVRKYIGRKG